MMNQKLPELRDQRLFNEPSKDDKRTPGQRDRDRILYTIYFRRLASVTQVVGPLEGFIFHNRLTHSLEVAQIGRRLAEKIKKENSDLNQLGGIDPDVVEAAALAHDLGHPPFGHIAEYELNSLVQKEEVADGYEGNAQTFRIVNHLAVHREDYRGLNLTRATLNAILKYPWLQGENPEKPDKFNAYQSEQKEFEFARSGYENSVRRSLEAQIMDYSDDIAYSIHDLDDFYRVGLISDEIKYNERFFDKFTEKWIASGKVKREDVIKYSEMLKDFIDPLFTEEKYKGTHEQRVELSTKKSALITQFINAISIQNPDQGGIILKVQDERWFQLKFLQRLVWDYVIDNPNIVTQQAGQRRIIAKLFEIYYDAVCKCDKTIIPFQFHKDVDDFCHNHDLQVRLAADIIASLSDEQAIGLYRRFMGISLGSVMDLLYV